MVTTGTIRRAKLQSDRHHQQANTQSCSQAGYPSCRPTNSIKALKGKKAGTVIYINVSVVGYTVLVIFTERCTVCLERN